MTKREFRKSDTILDKILKPAAQVNDDEPEVQVDGLKNPIDKRLENSPVLGNDNQGKKDRVDHIPG